MLTETRMAQGAKLKTIMPMLTAPSMTRGAGASEGDDARASEGDSVKTIFVLANGILAVIDGVSTHCGDENGPGG